MAKAIGFFLGVGTSLAAAMLWLAASGPSLETPSDVIAPIESTSNGLAAEGEHPAGREATQNSDRGLARDGASAADGPAAPVQAVSGNSESPSSDRESPMPVLWPTAKDRAAGLLEQARADLSAGRCLEAQDKAVRAEKMGVVYGLFEDRPALILDEAERIAATGRQNGDELLQARKDSTEERIQLPDEPDDKLPIVVPIGQVLPPSPTQKTSKWRARSRTLSARPKQERIKSCSGIAEEDDDS